jgi:hypothetical protein
LIADRIVIQGQLTAKGANGGGTVCACGGGGSGGGILIAADDLTFTGTVDISGGAAGTSCNFYNASAGGLGRIKLLYGTKKMISGAVTSISTLTQGLLPPLIVTSSTHPDPKLFYNDDFPSVGLTWNRPFAVQTYYWTVTQNTAQVPVLSPTVLDTNLEQVSIDPSKIQMGKNFFNIVPFDSNSQIGTVETAYRIQINGMAPTPASDTHPSAPPATWYDNRNVVFKWNATLPNGDQNYSGIYYLIDTFGNTIPTKSATFLPVTQKSIRVENLPQSTISFLHILSVDTRGYLTKSANHFKVQIGPSPGLGDLQGHVQNMTSQAFISGATVTLNRGLATATTDSGGFFSINYDSAKVPAGSYELKVTAGGFQSATRTVTVTKDQLTTADFMLAPSP